ncbi:MFS transporter [Micromonospora sp. CA-259024]|uniref:MFS transporter n=1 Tax=Micromonospora sp. CA-259024 TaxID=3239965 RepID=UPI003D92C07D
MRRNAGLFVAISLLSGFGSSAMSLVAGIWILDLTGSTGLAALAGLCVYAPVLAGPWLGGVLDRAPRRPLVIAVNLMLAAVLPALLAVRGPGQTWLIFAVSCAYGVSYVLIDAGETALLPSALPSSELGQVNGWRSSAQEGMKLVAPLAGAGLYAWRGGHAVVVLSAAMPVLVAILYAAVRLHRTPPEQPTQRRHGPRAGISVLFGQQATRVPIVLAAVSIAMSGFSTAAVYTIVVSELHLPTTFLGVLASAQGAGSIVGGLVVGRLISRWNPVGVGMAGTVLFALGCLARCLPWWPVTVGGAALAGVGLPWTLVAAVTAVQTHTPATLLGRVSATANTAMFGPLVVAIPLGSAAVHLGARPPLIAAVVICLAAVAATSDRLSSRRNTRLIAGRGHVTRCRNRRLATPCGPAERVDPGPARGPGRDQVSGRRTRGSPSG